jgi:hypothetical protein
LRVVLEFLQFLLGCFFDYAGELLTGLGLLLFLGAISAQIWIAAVVRLVMMNAGFFMMRVSLNWNSGAKAAIVPFLTGCG